jgi:hypothetical protein
LAFLAEKNFTDKIFLIIKNFLITSSHLQNFHPHSKFSSQNFPPSKIFHSKIFKPEPLGLKNKCAAIEDSSSILLRPKFTNPD